ncbi:MAG: OmpA family protein [Bacteroidota bacterium]
MSPRMRRLLGAAVLVVLAFPAALAPSFARADDPVGWVAPGGGVLWIPNEFGVTPHRPMFGGILGVSLSPSWALEARGIVASSPSDTVGRGNLKLFHASGDLTWFLLHGRVRPYLLAGAGAMHLDGAGVSATKLALNGGLGFHIPLTDRLALRVDGRDVAYKVFVSQEKGEVYKHGPEAFAALSFGFGAPSRDSDRDGVPDKKDRCPGTPFGARVDASGCPIDTDGDGVPDGIDRCDNTPRGATVDATGCPMDSDGDGVPDGIDQCSNTPQGARVDAKGCPVDTDGDTVPDGLDQCPDTPNGCVVDRNGCPTDSDGDGVCDGLDKCPDTPPDARVDANGCPITVSTKETELLETGMIRLQDVNFDTGKATIQPESFAALDEVGNILGRWPDLRIEIAGHTDSRGSDARNLALSQARANAVREYLIHKFPELRPEQFTAKGYGETQPIASNTTVLGRARNRRVEFRVLNKETLRKESEKRGLAPKE